MPAPAAAGQPAPAPLVTNGAARAVPDRYIVVLKAQAAGSALERSSVAQDAARHGGQVPRRYQRVMDGFVARLPAAALAKVRANPAVKYIEPDSIITAEGTMTAGSSDVTTSAIQPNPPWGLDRVDPTAGSPAG